jgi:predicted ATP-grasp superfamily ATP-dependent carboligase
VVRLRGGAGDPGRARYRGVVLDVDTWPQLRDPVLVVALTGWVDAGEAGAVAGASVAANLENGRVFGRYDLTDLVDLQQTRPTVELVDGATRSITWPSIELTAGQSGRDVVVALGPEPSLRWPTVTRELVDAFVRLGVTEAFTLGGMPAVASHRRPVSVQCTASSRSLAQEVGAIRSDYVGPTGIQTVLQVELGDRGIPTVGLWAQVPHYVAGNPSPPAVRALLERLRELTGVRVDLSLLDDQADTYADKVEEGLADRPDVAELVRAIEEQSVDDVSGDALAAEIERFLREQQ